MTNIIRIIIGAIVAFSLGYAAYTYQMIADEEMPVIGIANYGPHSSLYETIDGLKEHLESRGYVEGKNIRYEIVDVNFDTSLIMQMLSKLKATKPDVIVALSTPIAQSAKNLIKDIPVVFADVTDPEKAGLVSEGQTNITGAADKQDIGLMLDFAKKLLPGAKKLGVLYSTGEANDLALIEMLEIKAREKQIDVTLMPVSHPREVALQVNKLAGRVDFIYTGPSGAIQAAMPAIIAEANKTKIPVINFDADDVENHQALASYGVSYYSIGNNVGQLVNEILAGTPPGELKIIYPTPSDHKGVVSAIKAGKLGVKIPSLDNIRIVE